VVPVLLDELPVDPLPLPPPAPLPLVEEPEPEEDVVSPEVLPF